ENNPLPGSATPVPDRLGVPAWLYDLIKAGIKSLGVNGMVMCLIAFSTHHRRREPETAKIEPVAVPVEINPRSVITMIESPKPQEIGDLRRYILTCIPRNKGADFTWGAAYARYRRWCEESGFVPMELKRFFDEFGQVCARAKIHTEQRDGKLYCID